MKTTPISTESLKAVLTQTGIKPLLTRVGLWTPAATAWRTFSGDPRQQPVNDDYKTFSRHYRFLSESAGRTSSSPRVLVISLTDFVAQVKIESLLAKALQLRGYTPVILTRKGCRSALRYYRVFGYSQFIVLEKYFQKQIPPEAVRQIDSLLTAPTFESVKAFCYRRIEIGRQALATAVHRLHQGNVSLTDPSVRAMVRELLYQGVRMAEAAQTIYDQVAPALALVNDAMYVHVGAIFEEALNRQIPVIQWVGSQRDDAMILKRFDRETKRIHPCSLSEETWEMVQRSAWTSESEEELRRDFDERYVAKRWTSYYNQAYGSVKTREQVQQILGLDPRKKTAVIFAHMLWDSTLFWGQDVFADYEEWLVATVQAACANSNLNWVVKFHPANIWKLKRDRLGGEPIERKVLRERLGQLPAHLTFLEADADLSTFSLFEAADYCLTVRGTIGIEMAAFGVPVVTAGTGRYSGRGFTIDCTSQEEYLTRLARLHELPRLTTAQRELAKKYAHALFIRRPARFRTFEPTYKSLNEVGHPLDHNVAIHVSSFDELAAASDLRAFAEWAIDSRDRDFLTDTDVKVTAPCAVSSV